MELVEFEPETSYEIERVFAEFASVMAGDRGFEPRLTDPERYVMPLSYQSRRGTSRPSI